MNRTDAETRADDVTSAAMRTPRQSTAMAMLGCVAIIAVVIASIGATNPPTDKRRAHPLVLHSGDTNEFVLSAVQIIRFDKTVARFDARTGELFKLHGNLSNPSTQSYWRLHVPKVNGATSGVLELQQAAGETFLVDVIKGRTWLLSRRGTNATWDEIRVIR